MIRQRQRWITRMGLLLGVVLGLGPAIGSLPAGAAPASAPDWPQILLTQITDGLTDPVHVTHAGDGSGRLFVVERAGRIRIIQNGVLLPTPFLDITARVDDSFAEEGLLSVAFPPGFGSGPTLRHFYVYYVNNAGDLSISRFQVSAGDDNLADANSEEVILPIPHPTHENHDGGQLAFGPNDGYLYIATGDGGGSGDPGENAQDPNELLGKILRLDVESGASPYAVPPSNPFTQTVGYRAEIWALGLRNPWRFSFDQATGDLFLGDVGQGAWEEINVQPAASPGGENYGWDCYEGDASFELAGCGAQSSYTFPVHTYANDSSTCAVVGGHVYRGAQSVSMLGVYLFSDNCGGQIWGLRHDGLDWQSTLLLDTSLNPSSFGEDEAGNLYLADLSGGAIYRIDGLDERLFLPLVRN